MSSCPLQPSSSRRDTVTQPPSPSRNPRGLCTRAFPSGNPQGCAAVALPGVHAQHIISPERVVPKDRMGGMWYWVYICKSFREDRSSPPANPIPFRPLISHPPTGTNGTTPCGVGNALRPEPGVARKPAQPRAVWHNVVDVGEAISDQVREPSFAGLYGTTSLTLGREERIHT